MVDVKKIAQLLNTYFTIPGSYKIDPHTGVVHVQGDVGLTKTTFKLPVQFGRVSGYFSVVGNKLTSLSGAPAQVGGSFLCHSNELTNLEGSPDHVGGIFSVSYDQNLPLLRLCGYRSVNISACPNKVQHIMKKYAGQGKPGALLAAAELIRAGYARNARW